jgi:hypothetical protein
MTLTDRLGDYVVFFHDTMSKISRNYRQKQVRTEQHSRGPRIRRKSTLEEILKNGNPASPKLVSERDRASPATLSLPSASANQVLNVQMGRVPIQTEGTEREFIVDVLLGCISLFCVVVRYSKSVRGRRSSRRLLCGAVRTQFPLPACCG